MNVIKTDFPEVLVFEPDVFSDERGYFFETWNSKRYAGVQIPETFAQDNVSFSCKGTVRGLHFQHPHEQGKLVTVLAGEVLDVAVDIRAESPTFGKWIGVKLSQNNHRQMYIPPGFAHGFCVVSDTAIFCYKCTDYYNASTDKGIIWNDPDLAIDWPVENPLLSDKDAHLSTLKNLSEQDLPHLRIAK